jgi:O-antigen ligase
LTLSLALGPSRSWASGWLPPLVAVVTILWFSFPRLALLATVLGGGLAAANYQAVISLVMVGDQQYSLMTRTAAWQIVAQLVKSNPLLGLGWANYHWYAQLYPIAGYYVPFNSHNNFVDLVAQAGLLGLACFGWLAWRLGWLAIRVRSGADCGFARAYAYGCLGGLAGMLAAGMLGDWFLPFVYNVGMNGFRTSIVAWLFLGGLGVLLPAAPAHNQNGQPEGPP